MVNNVELLFMCLFSICIPSIVKSLLKLIAHFLVGFLGKILLLSSKSSLYIFWIESFER